MTLRRIALALAAPVCAFAFSIALSSLVLLAVGTKKGHRIGVAPLL